MKKLLLGLIGLSLVSIPALAGESKLKKGFYTMDSLGCMIIRECTKDVQRIKSIDDIRKKFPDSNFDYVADEFNSMLVSLDKVGVMVFLGHEKYFPPGHRGAYHTVSNNFYLNDAFVHRPHVLMTVMRHEGWHAAQDCMAGTLNNSLIALIYPEEKVPQVWRDIVEKSYPKSAVPFEAEAKWAGMTQGMTAKALGACTTGKMWEIYEPTPLTEKWLREEGYINK
jgi:hypothetical protein